MKLPFIQKEIAYQISTSIEKKLGLEIKHFISCPINIEGLFNSFYSNEKELSVYSYLTNPVYRRVNTWDFSKYLATKYNLPLRFKPLEINQDFSYMSQKQFIESWSQSLFHINLDPHITHPGQQAIQVACVGSLNIGGMNESHQHLFPETATTDLKVVEEKFKEYLNANYLDYNIVLQKLYIEHLWNSLIYNKYNNKVNIDEEKIKDRIKKQIDSQKEIININLSEIIFTINSKSDLNKKIQEINLSIEEIGFEDTAKLHSVSESGKFGGKLGWINVNQLSTVLENKLKNIEAGNFTQPIKIADGYMILFVNERKIEKKKIDLDKALSKAVAYEKNKQLSEFSRLHFKKLAVNIKIE